jgi:hypothetical protein
MPIGGRRRRLGWRGHHQPCVIREVYEDMAHEMKGGTTKEEDRRWGLMSRKKYALGM